MSKENNLTDFLTDVADAIREKKGTTDKINPQDFSDEIKSIKTSTSMWTGHVDVEGLKAIGWDDDDIAYFQEHGVNWMEEDDEYYKVPEDNKALYGVVNADNIQEYKDRIVWLPKIDFSGVTNLSSLFYDFRGLLAIPILYFPDATNLSAVLYGCTALKCAKIIAPNASRISNLAYNCVSIRHIELINLPASCICGSAFRKCRNLTYVNIKKLIPIGDAPYIFAECHGITKLPKLDVSQSASMSSLCNDCTSLVILEIDSVYQSLNVSLCTMLNKYSILYIINHEAATEPITITLHATAYARLSTDPDIVEALSNHPLVTLASA